MLCTIPQHAREASTLTWCCWNGVAVLPPRNLRFWRSTDFALQNDLATDVNLQICEVLYHVRCCLCYSHKGKQDTVRFQETPPTALPSSLLWPPAWPLWAGSGKDLVDEWQQKSPKRLWEGCSEFSWLIFKLTKLRFGFSSNLLEFLILWRKQRTVSG